MTAHLESLHALIQSHGFQSWTYSGDIEISVPATWVDEQGLVVEGEEILRCSATVDAVRHALGY